MWRVKKMIINLWTRFFFYTVSTFHLIKYHKPHLSRRDLSKNRRLDLDLVKQLLHNFLGTFHLVMAPQTWEISVPPQPLMEYGQCSRVRFKKHEEVGVQLNRVGVRSSATWGKRRKQTPNSVHSGAGETGYRADISGGNENIYNTWV